jgi:aryl-alcohol dehydrogenase-like predicted oxidoreductase
MEHRATGLSDFELPVVTFGAWAIGGLFWGGSDDDDAIQAIHAAIDHGVDAIDTAAIYGCGHSEIIVGKAIEGRRNRVTILTKCGLRWDSTEGEFHFTFPNADGSEVTAYKNVTAKSIQYECEQSLRRLRIDTIDLYQVHWPSTSAPAEETMTALTRLQERGKIRHIGVSNYNAAQLAEALKYAAVISNQVRYNLLDRSIEAQTRPFCRENNVGVICYSPMAMGLLTGKMTIERAFPPSDLRSSFKWYQPPNRRRALDALENIRPIADAHHATLGQLAVAWVLAQPGITAALVGARNARQAEENAGAARIKLSQEEVGEMRRVFEAVGEPETE